MPTDRRFVFIRSFGVPIDTRFDIALQLLGDLLGCADMAGLADLLALCHSRERAEQVKARLAEWLQPRGSTW